MPGFAEVVRNLCENNPQIRAENSDADIFAAQKAREAHALIRARLAEISVTEARHSMTTEKITSDLIAFVGMQLFAEEEWKGNRALAKEISTAVQSLIRTYYMKNIEAALAKSPDGEVSFDELPMPDITDDPGDAAGQEDRGGKGPQEGRGKPPEGQGENNGTGQGRRRISKAFFITIPLALLALTFSLGSNGHQTLIPLWQRVIFAVLIAALGSRRLRRPAFGLLIVAFIVAWILGG